MKLQLSLISLQANTNIANKLLLKVVVNGIIQFKTDWAVGNSKTHIYPLYETNTIFLSNEQLNYIKFQVCNQKKVIIGEKTLLNADIKNKTEIQFQMKESKIILHYSLKEKIQEQLQSDLQFKKKISLDQQPEIMKDKQGRLQILKLGTTVFYFCQRLDPVIWIYNLMRDIIIWKSPSFTIGVGVILTLIILNLKISILLGGICLMFGKNRIIKYVQKISRKKNVHKRLFVPKQNAIFLQNSVESYYQFYEKAHNFFLNQDKTDVILLIHYVCKFSFFMVILLFIFGVQNLVVLSLWSLLLLTSPSGVKLYKQLWPSFLFLDKQTQKISNKVTEYVKKTLGSSQAKQNTVVKQFYFYQYQRWFVGKGWTIPPIILEYHYADQTWKVQIVPKINPPQGWSWLNEYEIQYFQQADHHGYQYRNDLTKKFINKSNFATLRRRKYVRRCQLINKKKQKTV